MSTSQQVSFRKRELKYDTLSNSLNIDFELHGSWRSDAVDTIFQDIQKYPKTVRIIFEIHFEDKDTFTADEQTTIRNRIIEISRSINRLVVGRDGGPSKFGIVEVIFHMPRFSTRRLKCGSGFSLLKPFWTFYYTYEVNNHGNCYRYENGSRGADVEKEIDKHAREKRLPNDG
ncbi:hypothetical protein EAE96_006990 [Botrytis aclada]|nr:hypothetical protein EAE96_006990 [Botrytis aclada]